MKRILIYLIILACNTFPMTGYSQVDSLRKEYQKEFNDFSRTIQQDFNAFRKRNDSIFLEFLGQSWQTFEAFRSESVMKPKPKEQPVREKSEIHLNPIKPRNIFIPEDKSLQEREIIESPDDGAFINSFSGAPSMAFDFYGSEVMIIPPREKLPRLKIVSPMYFVEFFQEAASSEILSENIARLHDQARLMNLNDWGLVRLLKTAAESLFPDRNDQVLFVWFGLIRCGYDVRTGYDQNGVYLLAPARQALYNTVYFVIRNKTYFLLKIDGREADIANLNTYEMGYPGNDMPVCLLLNDLPKLPGEITERKITSQGEITLALDKNLADYLSTYPECHLAVSLTAPMSAVAREAFKKGIGPALKGMDEYQKVNYLLKLLQYGFPYKTDIEQFGRENYLFAEEVLFYPYSDCEDRTALLARLVELFTGLETIALCYPDHVTLGVGFPVKQDGAYVDYNGKRYYICDPTYIGAEIGMLMPDYQGVNPDIIDLQSIK